MEKKYDDIIKKIAKYAYKKFDGLSEEYSTFNKYLKAIDERTKEYKKISSFNLSDIFLGDHPEDYEEYHYENYYPFDDLKFLSEFLEDNQLSDSELNDFSKLFEKTFQDQWKLFEKDYVEVDTAMGETATNYAYDSISQIKMFYDLAKCLNELTKYNFIPSKNFDKHFEKSIPDCCIELYDKMRNKIYGCSFDICNITIAIAGDETLEEKIERLSEKSKEKITYNIFDQNLTINEISKYFVDNFPDLDCKPRKEIIESLENFLGKDSDLITTEWFNPDSQSLCDTFHFKFLDYWKCLSDEIKTYKDFLRYNKEGVLFTGHLYSGNEIKEFINKFSCFEKIDFDHFNRNNIEDILETGNTDDGPGDDGNIDDDYGWNAYDDAYEK